MKDGIKKVWSRWISALLSRNAEADRRIADEKTSAAFDELQDFQKWCAACDEILKRPFPPTSSNCDPTTLAADAEVDLTRMSNWSIACEEVLDTEHSHVYLQKCHEELCRRGKTDADIHEMREFVWQVVGWYNFSMMVWENWFFDEEAVRRAIDCLHEKRQIDEVDRRRMLDFLEKHA